MSPSLLLPFAACVARRVEVTVSVLCGGVVAVTDGTQLEAGEDFPTIAQDVSIVLGGKITSARPVLTRANPDPSAWETLNKFAHLTYAPATEESRLLGAGAGLSDND